MVELSLLFNMQKELDHHIEAAHGLTGEHLLDKKILALLVELGELANETRAFKFWSKKAPAHKDVILEEYVDGVHFILSIGLEMGLEQEVTWQGEHGSKDVNEQFLAVFAAITNLQMSKASSAFTSVCHEYILLGQLLGLTEDDIFTGYMRKNEVNHNRQNEGY